MKKLHNILAVTAIALTFTACSSDNESTSNNEGKEYPISLSVGIGDLSVVTRAGSTQLTSGDLGLYIIKNLLKTSKCIILEQTANNKIFTSKITVKQN